MTWLAICSSVFVQAMYLVQERMGRGIIPLHEDHIHISSKAYPYVLQAIETNCHAHISMQA